MTGVQTCALPICGITVTTTGFKVTDAFWEELYDAVTMTWVELFSVAEDVAVNVQVFDPAGTVTFAGTERRLGLLAASATNAPPAGAAPLSVMVPVDEAPGPMEVGLNERLMIETDGRNGPGAEAIRWL